MLREYSSIREVAGPLVLVEGVSGVKLGERVEIAQGGDRARAGCVLELDGDCALLKLFESAQGLRIDAAKARFLGRPVELSASMDMLGRVFDGMGRPRDGGPEIIAEMRLDINGAPINPAARDCPDEFIQTGISAIDGLNTLVRGQKLPVFSGIGLPHARLAAQIARQARLIKARSAGLAVVIGAIGVPFEEAELLIGELRATGAIDRSVLFMNMAGDPAVERVVAPRMALTAAEYLAFERDMHVLVILTDMTCYAEALRELSAARRQPPGRRGYPGYLHADLASMYERAGRIRGKSGSLTLIPMLTMPGDDVAHPVPDQTGHITDGQILLSRALHRRGLTPPIDVPASLSRAMGRGIGEGKTRKDHAPCAKRLVCAYLHGRDARELAGVLGGAGLSGMDKRYAEFADAFEKRFVSQRFDEERDIEHTLRIGWELLGMLPRSEHGRIPDELLDEFLPSDPHGEGNDAL